MRKRKRLSECSFCAKGGASKGRSLAFCLLAALLLLSGCFGGDAWVRKQEAAGETEEAGTELREKTLLSVQKEAQKQKRMEQVERAFEEILRSCTNEFIGAHPLDERFLTWFLEEYGEESVLAVADALRAGNAKQTLWHTLTGSSIHVLWLLYCEAQGRVPCPGENLIWQPCHSSEETTLAFTGDINFSEGYVTTRKMDSSPNGILDCFSSDLLELMKGVDVMTVNNEFTYSTRGEPLSGKAFTFRADPGRVELLDAFGTDLVNLANNHVYDYGPDALLDTMATLKEAGFPYVGAGKNLEEAKKPYYFVCNGWKIAIAAATQIERSTNYTKEATEDSPGVLKTLQPDKFAEVLKDAKKNSDIVIAFVHWGTEGDSYFGADQRALAEEFVAAGADAVIGGHTHCLQGFEVMDGVPILYSLGNFWFSGRTQDTGLAKVTIDREGELSLSFLPCIQENTRTSLVTEEAERQRIFEFLRRHSAEGTTLAEDGTVRLE